MEKNFCIIILSTLLFSCGAADDCKEVSGILRFGHEVRSFTNLEDSKEYWIVDKSGKLMAEYKKIIGTEIINNRPVSAKLKVKKVEKQPDGFGKEYTGTYEVKEIIYLGLNKAENM